MSTPDESPSRETSVTKDIGNPEADELWAQYQRRQVKFGRISKVGGVLLGFLALAILAIGLWIVAFR